MKDKIIALYNEVFDKGQVATEEDREAARLAKELEQKAKLDEKQVKDTTLYPYYNLCCREVEAMFACTHNSILASRVAAPTPSSGFCRRRGSTAGGDR